MNIFFSVLFFLFGSSLGSFVNVIADRLYVAPILTGRSKCLSCSKILAWFDLIPIFSFLHHGGKCRNCKTRLGYEHLIVEALYGILFVAFYFIFLIPRGFTLIGLGWLAFYTVFFVTLGVVALYDIKHKVIPSLFLFLFLIQCLIVLVIRYFDESNLLVLLDPFIVSLPFLILFLISRGKWLGFGDVLMYMGVGAFFGISQGVTVLLVSLWSGALFGIYILISQKLKLGSKKELPFVPFIVLAIVIVLFTDINLDNIINLFNYVII